RRQDRPHLSRVRVHAAAGSEGASLSGGASGNVAEAYDRIAAAYDRQIRGDEWMRRALHADYARTFVPGQTVLDIGCGTGADTLELARRGVRVVAVDASSAMVEQLRQRVAHAGLDALVDARVLDIAELARLDIPALDGAVSAFAPLSTVPDLPY